jgi:hypothetical protein
VGAFSGIVGWIGSLGVWSFSTSTPPAPALRRTVIMFLIVVGALSVLLGGSLWGPLGGLVGGVLAMLLLGPRRVHLRPGLATLLTAIALFGGIAVAAASQLTATDTLERERLAPLFEELTAVERLADRLYERPDHARPEERAELSRRLDALLAADTLEGLEGHHELEAYLDTLRPVATGDIPDPLAFEHRRRQARGAWRPHEKRLRAASGATRSFN